jgi:hypothetical protein
MRGSGFVGNIYPPLNDVGQAGLPGEFPGAGAVTWSLGALGAHCLAIVRPVHGTNI